MHTTTARRGLLLLLLLMLLMGLPQLANSQELPAAVTVDAMRQEDLDGDGTLDLTVLEAVFAGQQGEVRVFGSPPPLRQGDDWRSVTDFVNDTWLFDVGGDGSAQLIIIFNEEANFITASFYDDQDGDGSVDFVVAGRTLQVTESPNWTARVVAQTKRWTDDEGYIDMNLRFLLDGVPTPAFLPESYLDRVADSIIDVEILEVATADPTVPAHEIRRVIAPTPANQGLVRTLIKVNVGGVRPLPATDHLFFPLLGESSRATSLKYFDTPPAIKYDWETATIVDAGLFGYPVEEGYHIQSNYYVRPRELAPADFENPMAYYDLARDHDGEPELHVRNQYYEPFNPWYFFRIPDPVNEIRYSWNQKNLPGNTWDFKVGLVGSHEVTSTVALGDFEITTVPYATFPQWVVEREWPFATLVEANREYLSSEGIYDWFPWYGEDITNIHSALPVTRAVELVQGGVNYMRGEDAVSPAEAFTAIPRGLRGEYRFETPGQPLLTFSPIDRRLHLLHAEGGLWNLDNETLITYSNNDGDGYIDEWTRAAMNLDGTPGAVFARLQVSRDYLIYADEREVVVKQVQIAPSVFETLPPTTHEEWSRLGQLLRDHEAAFAPDDLRAMAAQFAGPELTIRGATVRAYRATSAAGFRLELELQPGFTVQGAELFDVSQLAPGAAVLTYDGSAPVTAAPATPVDVQMQVTMPAQADLDTEGVIPISVRVENAGDLDLRALTLNAHLLGFEEPVEIAGLTLDALAEQPALQQLTWRPQQPGAYVVELDLLDAEGNLLAQERREIALLGRASDRPWPITASSTGRLHRLPGVLLLGMAAVGALIAGWKILRKPGRPDAP